MNGYGDEFEILSISTIHNIDFETCLEKYIVLGNNDGKIDAIYYPNDKDEPIVVYQVKEGIINASDKEHMRTNINEFLKSGKISEDHTKDLTLFCKKNENSIKGRSKEPIISVIANNVRKSHKEDILYDDIISLFFNNKFLPNQNNKLVINLEVPSLKISNRLQSNISINDKESQFVFIINATDFIEQLLSTEGLKSGERIGVLFNDNVRGALKNNCEMLSTLKQENGLLQEHFLHYNNGVTITGEVTYNEVESKIKIVNPTINNGQQTVHTLLNYYEKEKDLSNVEVMIIVKNINDLNVRSNISKYTNTQTKVNIIDLVSLSQSLRKFQKELFNDGQYFIKLYDKGETMFDDPINLVYKKHEVISIRDFLRVYFLDEDNIGDWKSSLNKSVSKIDLTIPVNFDTGKDTCKMIELYKLFLTSVRLEDRDTIRTCDIGIYAAMKFFNLDILEAYHLILCLNDKYFYKVDENKRHSKLIDLYKSNQIYEKIVEVYELKKYSKREEYRCFLNINETYDNYYDFINFLQANKGVHTNLAKSIARKVWRNWQSYHPNVNPFLNQKITIEDFGTQLSSDYFNHVIEFQKYKF